MENVIIPDEVYINEYKNKIINRIEAVNSNPTLEGIKNVESGIDFYSDVYKDIYGFRPRADIGEFRAMYKGQARTIFEDWWNNL